MDLKDKIFSFGIYGKSIEYLNNEEIDEAFQQPWAEFLTKEEHEEFSRTLSTHVIQRKEIIDCPMVVKMNLIAWRKYIFGNNFVFTQKYYFLVLDYLLKRGDFVSLKELRDKFSIDPKTMFYLSKKLKEKEVIEENNDGTKIKLREIVNREDIVEERTDTHFCVDMSQVIYFNNVKFDDQLKGHIREAKDGLGSNDLQKILGVKNKYTLKILQRVCQKYPSELKMVDSIDYKHTALKCFSIENLDQRNRNKIKMIEENKEGMVGVTDKTLTSADRRMILRMLANEKTHYSLNKETLVRIRDMSGYPYTIDRKNLIENAKAEGLKVFKTKGHKNGVSSIIIALPHCDSSILTQYIQTERRERSDIENLERFIMKIEHCNILDNGHIDSHTENVATIYKELLSQQYGHIDIQTKSIATIDKELRSVEYGAIKPINSMVLCRESILNFKMKSIWEIINVPKLNFRAECIHNVVMNNDFTDLKPFTLYLTPFTYTDIDYMPSEMHINFIEPENYSSKIYLLNDKIKSAIEAFNFFTLVQFLDLLKDDNLKETLVNATLPVKFTRLIKTVNSLCRNKSQIEEALDENGLRILIFKNISKLHDLLRNENLFKFQPTHLNFNKRCKFLSLISIQAQGYLDDNLVYKITSGNFNYVDQKELNKHYGCFLQKKPVEPGKHIPTVSSSSMQFGVLCVFFKKILLFQYNPRLDEIPEFNEISPEEILLYLKSKNISTGLSLKKSLSRISISKDFTKFYYFNTFQSIKMPNDTLYYSVYERKLREIVTSCGSIDFDCLLERMKYMEALELDTFLQTHTDEYQENISNGFRIISLKNLADPFE